MFTKMAHEKVKNTHEKVKTKKNLIQVLNISFQTQQSRIIQLNHVNHIEIMVTISTYLLQIHIISHKL